MLKVTSMDGAPIATGQSLLRVSENEVQMRQPGQAHHPGIDRINEARAPVPHRIVEGERRLKRASAPGKAAVLAQGRTNHALTDHLRRRVEPLPAESQQFARNLVRFFQLTALEMEH